VRFPSNPGRVGKAEGNLPEGVADPNPIPLGFPCLTLGIFSGDLSNVGVGDLPDGVLGLEEVDKMDNLD